VRDITQICQFGKNNTLVLAAKNCTVEKSNIAPGRELEKQAANTNIVQEVEQNEQNKH